jgi:hypothetical protein
MIRKMAVIAAIIMVPLLLGAKSCASPAKVGVNGYLTVNGAYVEGHYSLNGGTKGRNAVGELRWRPTLTGGKWIRESDTATAISSDTSPAEGVTRAYRSKGLWQLRVTITDSEGNVVSEWKSNRYWVRLGYFGD